MKKFLRILAIILAVIIIGYTVACYFRPKNFNVSESKTMDASPAVVFNIINNVKSWETWNDWNLQDTGMIVTYTDQVTGKGAKSTWTNAASGDGTQEIVESIENRRLKTKLNFEGWDGDNFGIFDLKENGDKTDVTWSFEGVEVPFFMRGMMLTAVSGMKKSYKAGLENINVIALERMKGTYNGYQVKNVDLDEKHFVMRRQEVKTSAIQQFYASNLGQLFGNLQASGIEMNGMPCGLFFRMDERDGMIDMAAAMPIKEAIALADASTYSIPHKMGIQVDYYGEYNGSTAAHNAIKAYIKDRGYHEDVPIIEEYVTDPGEEPDPSKWLTRITYYYSE